MSANEIQIQVEVLQPEISGQIQQITSHELKNWILEGKLKPNHQVRIKNLSWMEAHKIPAFQSLFETVRYEQENKSDVIVNTILSNTTSSKTTNKSSAKTKKTASSADKITTKTEKDDSNPKNKQKTAEHSIAYKLFEQKSKSGAKNKELKPKYSRISPVLNAKSYLVKRIAGFIAGCVLTCLLALGGSYSWVYLLKTRAKIDEKAIPELSSLEYKLPSDKVELRLKKVEIEKEIDPANSQELSVQKSTYSKEVEKLENQFKIDRKNIIKQRTEKLQNDDFYTTFYFSLAVLLSLFLFLKVFNNRTEEKIEIHKESDLLDVEIPDDLNIPAAVDETNDPEKHQIIDPTNPSDIPITKSTEENSTTATNVIVTHVVVHQNAETAEMNQTIKSELCYLHLDKSADFVCVRCKNHFCADCTVTFEEEKDCCPFCRIVCVPFVEKSNSSVLLKLQAEKKKPSLLEMGKLTDFKVRDFQDERTQKITILRAILISVLFSISISIFWVYKFLPYLENREKEISQNAVNVNGNTSEDLSNKTVKADNSKAKADSKAVDPCIDKNTKKPIECDDVTRRTLEIQKEKAESIEKSNRILGVITPSSSPESEDANPESEKPDPVDEERREFEKQQFIKVFICSFLGIFGLLMLARLYSKDKNVLNETEEIT